LPLESLVLETDAPSMPLSPEVMGTEVKSKEFMAKEAISQEVATNSPINLIKIFNVLTTIRTESSEEIAEQLEHNIEQVFFT